MKTDKILNYIFYFSVLVFFIGFNFMDNPQGGWQLQLIDGLGGRSISDIFFLDSSNGWAVTSYIYNDSAFVLKTTNGGDSWFISNKKFNEYVGYNKIKFINNNTGYLCGKYQSGNFAKTTDGGYNWTQLNVPNPTVEFKDMSILNEDTIWLVASSTLTGGVFRTINGGQSWIQQLSAGNQNPDKIYMYNARIGFIVNTSVNYNLRKTTNGGVNWFTVLNSCYDDICFIDSLTGWRSWGSNFFKTTNGGLNWNSYQLPQGVNIITSRANSISVINEDTLWASGSVYWFGSKFRGIVMRSTNSGINWYYQIPDTSYQIPRFYHIKFLTNLIGWSYCISNGVHTTTGGDTNFITSMNNNNISELPEVFILYQNYPNPFNQSSIINVQCSIGGEVKLKVYDINGKVVKILIDEYKPEGTYSVRFDAGGLSSGIYFYSLIVDGIVVDTKKAILTR